MANNENPTGAGSFKSITMGNDGPDITEGNQDAISSNGVEDAADDTLDGVDPNAATEDGAGDDGAEADADGGDEEGVVPEDLGEFDPEDTEAWDNQYQDDNGQFREDVLTAEWDANKGEGLNEGIYAYLESRGFKKDFVKEVEAAFATQRDAKAKPSNEFDMELMTLAGGPDPLKEALDWGKEGGYDKTAQDRFNKVMEGTDNDAKREAVELLMARHGRSKPVKKPQTPARDITQGRAAPARSGVKGFASKEDHRKALAAAGDNQELVKQVAKRRRVSKW